MRHREKNTGVNKPILVDNSAEINIRNETEELKNNPDPLQSWTRILCWVQCCKVLQCLYYVAEQTL